MGARCGRETFLDQTGSNVKIGVVILVTCPHPSYGRRAIKRSTTTRGFARRGAFARSFSRAFAATLPFSPLRQSLFYHSGLCGIERVKRSFKLHARPLDKALDLWRTFVPLARAFAWALSGIGGNTLLLLTVIRRCENPQQKALRATGAIDKHFDDDTAHARFNEAVGSP
ncbi:hypothetical protein [Trinickia symbiotica]|uniref:hypothetical protein n=1 Tax=Trinickia symbiotica TaxID=863227 RepID=UPI000D15AA85|nr:hypothetical protein [Trinickia symbiotica]